MRLGGSRHPRRPRLAVELACGGLVAALAGVAAAFSGDIPLAERRSGYEMMSRASRAMQDDDTANPAMLWLLDGEATWNLPAGEARRACADCHGSATTSMKGVAARYPAFDGARGRPVDIEERINLCRTERQQAAPLPFESRDLLALTVYVARQSRGMPIQSDERLRPVIEMGRAIYGRRQGQLNLSCAQCHDDNWDKRLAGNVVTQGHPTGYPIYRLEWQSVGSLQRRLRNCFIGIRAEPYDYGAPEHVALEAFLMWRARGMAVESPAVRP